MRKSRNFKKRLRARGYPHNLIEKVTSEVKFTERKSALQTKNEVREKILPFVSTYHPALPNLKNILMSKWHLNQDQPLLREIYNEPPIISYKRAKSLGEQKLKVTYHMHVNALRITSDLAHIYFTLLYYVISVTICRGAQRTKALSRSRKFWSPKMNLNALVCRFPSVFGNYITILDQVSKIRCFLPFRILY